MKFLKRFESHEEGMSREQMCDLLCKCGYAMEELEGCSNYELREMCRTANMSKLLKNELLHTWHKLHCFDVW